MTQTIIPGFAELVANRPPPDPKPATLPLSEAGRLRRNRKQQVNRRRRERLAVTGDEIASAIDKALRNLK